MERALHDGTRRSVSVHSLQACVSSSYESGRKKMNSSTAVQSARMLSKSGCPAVQARSRSKSAARRTISWSSVE